MYNPSLLNEKITEAPVDTLHKKLNTILLIDDDGPTNFINEYTIMRQACADKVVAMESTREALDFLWQCIKDGHELPELLFLDVHMPAMSGWEFLNAFHQLNSTRITEVKIVMLTGILDPSDSERALEFPVIKDIVQKPLSSQKLRQILGKYFSATAEKRIQTG